MNLDNHNEIVEALRRASEERITTTRRVHLHLGVISGIGMALDAIREAGLSPSHPARKAVFDLLMTINEANVTEIIKQRYEQEIET